MAYPGKLAVGVWAGARPAAFDYGRNADRERPFEPGWDLSPIGIPVLRIHPMRLLSDDDWLAIRLYRAWRGGGFSAGPLPYAGGFAEQPSGLMAAFDHLLGVDAALQPEKRP